MFAAVKCHYYTAGAPAAAALLLLLLSCKSTRSIMTCSSVANGNALLKSVGSDDAVASYYSFPWR